MTKPSPELRPEPLPKLRYRFGVFEVDTATGELRRHGLRVRLHTQPFQVLCLLLARPGEMLTREEICRELWPEGTFVDYEHGVNSAVNRLREGLGDKASSPRYVETLARRGYRFVAQVERVGEPVAGPFAAAADAPGLPLAPIAEPDEAGLFDRVLARPEDLPASSRRVVVTLFVLLQAMYLGFYVGTLANLTEVADLVAELRMPQQVFAGLVVTAALLIPVRVFLACGVLFRAPGLRARLLRLWPFLLAADLLWALAPFLLLHHISFGLALACTTVLVYAPFAQRSLVLMGAGSADKEAAAT